MGKQNLYILSGLIFLLTACANVQTHETVEVFVSKTSEENTAEGLPYIDTGYKKVNAITSIESSKYHVKTDIKAIEDYYDLAGNYIKTVIVHSKFEKSYVTDAETGNKVTEELNRPTTILIPDVNAEEFKLNNFTKKQHEKVKDRVLSYVNKLY